MIGWPICELSRRLGAKLAWGLYPLWITFVVVATDS